MNPKILLQIAHVVFSVLLIGAVLLQSPESGLSGLFGGGGEVYHTKRGAEKAFFIATIVLGILFSATSALNFFFA